ncbi:LysR substrate-binding domain-containing protein [Pseudorhizobium pelagicum]|uniref:LysR substrate-binding domain-containing protein n=1 Tax=Pseudorhizobium pelagicum TaxID=1509405 RepID=UPI000689FE24|nr:LysR substrate-binding domain-containing protein [Pseudorhizobium pelagicum]
MQLPPLNALRNFEVASRSEFFKSAADELGVTPSAVGRQIKLLEDHLGVELFERRHASVQLTRAGEAYAQSVHACFAELELATLDLTRRGRNAPLRVWCSRTFMRQWLVPRLSEFRETHPQVNLVFSTSDGLRAVDGGTVDLAIRLGDGEWEGCTAIPLFKSALVPICSPTYVAKIGKPVVPAGILDHTLLQSLRRRDDWQIWLREMGLSKRAIRKSLSFEGESLAYQAAIEGVGIALGRSGLFEKDVEAGKLLTLFAEHKVSVPGTFCLVYPSQERLSPHAKAFRDWLVRHLDTADVSRSDGYDLLHNDQL